MTDRAKMNVKLVAAGLLLVAAVAFGLSRMRDVANSGEEGSRIWFYDESQQKLYAVPRDTLPPHRGVGGASDDGVKAIVVAPLAQQGDAAQRRIAYLETYTPELKKVLEDVRAAQVAGTRYEGTIPSGESEFFQKNTLVRRASDSQWYEAGSDEARAIMSEWRRWRDSEGAPLVVCVP